MKTKFSIRSQFIPRKGNIFLAMDLSQAESWIVAFSAREDNMKHALQHEDIHTLTASILFDKEKANVTKEERYIGKRCNHALSYRMSANRLFEIFNKDAQTTGVQLTLQQAKRYRTRWHEFYNISIWWGEIEIALNNNARTILNAYGWPRTFYGRWGDELLKKATAHIPQSSVAFHTNGAIHPELGIEGGWLGIHKWAKKNKGCFLVHHGHDSLMLEIPKNRENDIAPEVKPILERPLIINGEQFTIPVEVECGDRWGELQELKVA